MVFPATVRFFHFSGLTSLALAATFSLPLSVSAQTEQPATPASPTQAQPLEETDANQLRPLNQDSSLLSLPGGQRLMNEASNAASAQNYALAVDKLQVARQVFNQLSNFYQELAASFSGIDNRISDRLRQNAVDNAQKRDEATYQLALVHQAQTKAELAVPLLVQVIRSQNPTRDLGKKAYEQLSVILGQDNSLLSLNGGQRLMTEASSAVSEQNYDLAVKKLQEARQVFNQLSNFYQELAASFSGIDNGIADSQRKNAVESAQKRDEATYQLALIHRAQNKPELSVPLLVQIIRSQNPTRDLGKKAYQQLFELGFVDSPYPRSSRDRQSSSSNR
ncbi:hypothetical protein NIES2119_18665 [[Phormidium ambiguum] IAM M-71]|uniref:MalT-like TPR region domain-containing protein n=1 Tax=[Phormidium ambiguum] IAM M-71 TaxID=454136 RepID=A0A1U7IG12_9CYAN|nr:hypothetical protein NIES2119_18665 [Phormidium ambiguum IAM M-71]